jgi:hypothetical protein
MSVAALNGKTTGQIVEAVYDIDNGLVDHVIAETG